MAVVRILEPIPESEFEKLLEMLSTIKIPKTANNNRKGFLNARYLCWGLTKQRFGQKICLSAITKRRPDIWEEIKRLGSLLKNSDGSQFLFSSVHLNQNVECPPHKDKGNIGNSVLVGFGDYTGGHLCVESGAEYDIRHQPICFNGSQIEHWNTPMESGSKYSLVFYVHKCAFKVPCIPSEGATPPSQPRPQAELPDTPLAI